MIMYLRKCGKPSKRLRSLSVQPKTNSTARNQLIDGATDNRAIKDAVGDSVSDAPGVGNAIGLVAGIAAGIAFTYATKIYVNDNGKNITDEVKNYLYDIAGVN